jgi:hypothetical protein
MNANLVVISPQLPLFLKDLKTKQNLDFDMLHDSGNRSTAPSRAQGNLSEPPVTRS